MWNDEVRSFLKELIEAPSPSGFERWGQRRWASFVRAYADRVEQDAYGNQWAVLEGTDAGAPPVMLEAHADEVGFMVRYIDEKGFIYVTRIGGTDRAIVRSKRVRILGSKGEVRGVFGNVAIHLRDTKEEKIPEWHELYIDIGASSREEVHERGIRVGHPAIFADGLEELGPRRLVGRALDNRIGGFMVAMALRRLSENRPPATVYVVHAIQEEVGGYGARMVAYRLHPALALVTDVTHATDSPGIDSRKHGEVRLGGGPSLTHGSANHPALVAFLERVAAEEGIPIQHEAASTRTGTDTDDIFTVRGGIPSVLLSLPMRYMHSTVEMIDVGDVEACITLMERFAREAPIQLAEQIR